MGDIVQKVTTDLTFGQGGVLIPPGSLINIDVSKGTFNDDNTPNLADPGNAVVNVAVPVAPIGPTGPSPTMPQQVPPGAFQTTAGYVVPGGQLLVAEGSVAAAEAAANGTVADQNGVEEDAPVRRQPAEATGNATTSAISRQPASVPLGSEGAMSDADRSELEALRAEKKERDAAATEAAKTAAAAAAQTGGEQTFKPDSVIDGTVPEVSARLDGLSREQLLAVKDAEDDREQPRTGVKSAIDAAIAKIDEAANQA